MCPVDLTSCFVLYKDVNVCGVPSFAEVLSISYQPTEMGNWFLEKKFESKQLPFDARKDYINGDDTVKPLTPNNKIKMFFNLLAL